MAMLTTETIGGELYRYYPLGKHVVRAIGVCGSRPTFKYTRIEITGTLERLAAGENLDEIVAGYKGRVSREAILEAGQISHRTVFESTSKSGGCVVIVLDEQLLGRNSLYEQGKSLITQETTELYERSQSYLLRHAVSFTALRAAGHHRTMIETPPRPKTRSTTQLQRLLALGGSTTPTRPRYARGISTLPGTPGNSIVISRSSLTRPLH